MPLWWWIVSISGWSLFVFYNVSLFIITRNAKKRRKILMENEHLDRWR